MTTTIKKLEELKEYYIKNNISDFIDNDDIWWQYDNAICEWVQIGTREDYEREHTETYLY